MHRPLIWRISALVILLGAAFSAIETNADDPNRNLHTTTRAASAPVVLSGIVRDAEGQVTAVSAARSGGVIVVEDGERHLRLTTNVIYIQISVEELPVDGEPANDAVEGVAADEESTPSTDEEIRKQAEAVLIQRLITAGEIQGEGRFRTGLVEETGNPLDIAIMGDGFFCVQDFEGRVFYTRVGRFRVDGTGQLVTSDGYLLHPPVTIPLEFASDIIILEDGLVCGWNESNQTMQALGQYVISTFPNPCALATDGENRFALTDAAGHEMQNTPGRGGCGKLCQGCLETGSVDVLTELIDMMSRSADETEESQ
jgi:flagellar basal body rod protein FlgG